MRDYGSGSITKHPNGTYQVRMRISDNGTVLRKSFGYFKSRQQAARVLADLQTRYTDVAGRRIDTRHLPTVEAMATRWLDKAVAPGRHGTYRLYARMVRDYVVPVIGDKRLNEVTKADVDVIQTEAHQRLGPSSIDLLLTIGHGLFDYAIEKEEIAVKNPFARTKRKYKAKQRKYAVVDPAEGSRLLTVLQPSRYAHSFTLMLLCGLRINEALGLRWRDVDLLRKRLCVEGQVVTVDSRRFWDAETKTETSRRTLTPLPEPVIIALKEHRKAQMAETASDLVFTAPDGRPASDRSVGRDFHRLIAAAVNAGELPAVLGCGEPIADMRLHDLRHSYATILLLDGIPPTQVAANLGHKDATITLRVYSHVLPQSQQAAADVITKAFSAV